MKLVYVSVPLLYEACICQCTIIIFHKAIHFFVKKKHFLISAVYMELTHPMYFPSIEGRGVKSSVSSTLQVLPSSRVLKKYLNCPFLPKALLKSPKVGTGPLH